MLGAVDSVVEEVNKMPRAIISMLEGASRMLEAVDSVVEAVNNIPVSYTHLTLPTKLSV